MDGQLVVVKDVASRPLLRKVCYASENVVFVTSEKAFDLIKNGNSGLFPIGFRAENVFVYEGQDLTKKTNWANFKPWHHQDDNPCEQGQAVINESRAGFTRKNRF